MWVVVGGTWASLLLVWCSRMAVLLLPGLVASLTLLVWCSCLPWLPWLVATLSLLVATLSLLPWLVATLAWLVATLCVPWPWLVASLAWCGIPVCSGACLSVRACAEGCAPADAWAWRPASARGIVSVVFPVVAVFSCWGVAIPATALILLELLLPEFVFCRHDGCKNEKCFVFVFLVPSRLPAAMPSTHRSVRVGGEKVGAGLFP